MDSFPNYQTITQESLGDHPLADAVVVAWRRDKRFPRGLEALSVLYAFPNADKDEVKRVEDRLGDLDSRSGEWCYRDWGRDDGVTYESFYAQMQELYPEFSANAIGLVIDWNMFVSR